MASRAENRVVNLAGLVQGITLVTFPAASSIFTAADGYDLSNTLYGAMFLPQVLTAITMSLLGVGLAHRINAKRVLLIGLAANIISMVVLVLSTGFESDLAVAYPMLLVATAFLGAGFGLTVPVLNTFVAAFSPDRADRAVLVLNALLGLGTARTGCLDHDVGGRRWRRNRVLSGRLRHCGFRCRPARRPRHEPVHHPWLDRNCSSRNGCAVLRRRATPALPRTSAPTPNRPPTRSLSWN